MTRRDDHIDCDTPGCGATTSDDSDRLERWQTINDGEHPAADLCERCVARREAGVYDDPLALICGRCGRTRADGETQWWHVRDGRGELVTVCGGCHTPSDLTDVI